ncbi:type II toxin-antitoxin system RelE/ParE family toxin [Wolbachia pipientis]|nr:type II toxin-antitoxin system RelE/ParE family toxin [Wolbachia pipientis]
MPSGYNIEYSESVIERDIPALPVKVKSMVKKAILERLTVDPIGLGKPLKHNLSGQRSLRVRYTLLHRCTRTYSSYYLHRTQKRFLSKLILFIAP